MGLLSRKIKASKKTAVKGMFNIGAMKAILEADNQTVSREELLELNIVQRLEKKFDFDTAGILAIEEDDVDGLSGEHLEQYNEVSEYIDEVYKTAQDQVNAFITETSNHRSFNGWAKKNDIKYHMTWNTGKTEITLTACEVAGTKDVVDSEEA